MGTIAFGSLVLTIGRILRLLIEWIDKKTKSVKNIGLRFILGSLRCFCWCLDQFFQYLSKNAYIMCAIHGKPFCPSARDAFNLLCRNLLRTVAVNKIAGFLFFMTTLLVTIGAGVIAHLYFSSGEIGRSLNYMPVPVTIITIGTFLIAKLCLGVYSVAIDTMFLCFRKYFS